jgi:ferredoxin
MEIKINYKKCTICGNCVKVCQSKAIGIINNKVIVDNTKCDLCKSCIDICKKESSAITILSDVIDINDLIRDKINNHIYNEKSDQLFVEKIDKKKYVNDLKAHGWGFDVGKFVYIKKFSLEDIKKFNIEINLTAKKYNVPIFEVLCSISNDLVNIKTIFNMLNSENKAIVKNELIKKYNINKKPDTITEELFEDE